MSHVLSYQNAREVTVFFFFFFVFFFFNNTFIRFGTNLHRQVVCILIGTNYASLVAYVFLYDLMKPISRENQTLLKLLTDTGSVCFDQMFDPIHHAELQFNQTYSSDAKASFLDLNLMVQLPERFMLNATILIFPFLHNDV